MPRIPIDFTKALIYKLVCKDVNITECYVGSTTNFKARKYMHKNSCNNEKATGHNCYVYQFIRKNEGWENWDMVLVENYNADSNLDLRKRERYWTEELNANLNTNRSYVREEEIIEYKEEIADKQQTSRDEKRGISDQQKEKVEKIIQKLIDEKKKPMILRDIMIELIKEDKNNRIIMNRMLDSKQMKSIRNKLTRMKKKEII
jgi:hypothetical protein